MKSLKNKKFFSNKKAYNTIEVVITLAVSALLLWAIINALFPQLTHRLFPWLGGQGEYVTQDCDEDEIIGISDKCPCNKDIVEDAKAVCGTASETAVKNCPDLCKLSKATKSVKK